MNENITKVFCGDREFILVGTAHVSQESVSEVKSVIETEKPQRVCVELDEGRFRGLTEPQSWEKLDIFQIIRQGKGFLLLAQLTLSAFQRRMGESFESKPGEEMKAAVEKAQEVGIPFSLIDRDVGVTLRRAWAKSSFWGKNKLLAVLISSAFSDDEVEKDEIENLKKKNEMEGLMDGLAKELPTVKQVVIDERDHFLAAKLYETAESKVVAVVGAGHVPGMVKRLTQFHEGTLSPDTTEISQVPRPSVWSKIWPWIIPGLLVALFAAGFMVKGLDKFLEMALQWALFTGGLSALGTVLALGHPLTILTAFVLAPITTLHPLIGIGMFTGLVEAYFRKPRVKDFEALTQDLTSLRGFFRNRITRILLVFLFSSLGAMAAAWINLPWLSKSLFG